MPYSKIYRSEFTNRDKQRIQVDIIDTTTFNNTSDTYIPLDGAGCTIETVNNDEYRYTPIRAKKLTLYFYSTNNINYNTFTKGNYNRFKVICRTLQTGYIWFVGFLNQDDIREPHLPRPNRVTLVANDGLASLRGVSPTEVDGGRIEGHYRLIEYIHLCLLKTQLNLDIYVVSSLRDTSQPGQPHFQSLWFHSKTHETEIGSVEDGYASLEKHLKEGFILTQVNGAWWIVRGQDIGVYGFAHVYTDGMLSGITQITLDKYIGKNEDMYLIKEAAEAGIKRPRQFVKLDYNFDYPREIVDNIDFSRGSAKFPGIPAEIENSNPKQFELHYFIADWQTIKTDSFSGQNWFISNGVPIYSPYIYRKFNDRIDEIERYVVTGEIRDNNNFHWLKSNPVPVHAKDRINFSIDARLNTNIGGGQPYTMTVQFLLIPKDGSKDLLGFVKAPQTLEGDDDTEWKSISGLIRWENPDVGGADLFHVPLDGDVYIYLPFNHHGTQASRLTYYSNLSFEYIPYINGTYQKYRGQYHKVTGPGIYNVNYQNDVPISDSPRKLFKGALLKPSGWRQVYSGALTVFPGSGNNVYGTIVLPKGNFKVRVGMEVQLSVGPSGVYTIDTITDGGSVWNLGINSVIPGYNGNGVVSLRRYELAGPFTDKARPQPQPFGRLQAFDVWNAHDRYYNLFDLTVQGLKKNPELIHLFTLTDPSENTLGKKFLLLHYSFDLYECEWRGTVVEKGVLPDFGSSYEFRYVT